MESAGREASSADDGRADAPGPCYHRHVVNNCSYVTAPEHGVESARGQYHQYSDFWTLLCLVDSHWDQFQVELFHSPVRRFGGATALYGALVAVGQYDLRPGSLLSASRSPATTPTRPPTATPPNPRRPRHRPPSPWHETPETPPEERKTPKKRGNKKKEW